MGEQAHLTPEDIIARIDDWKGHDVRYEELGGGITNHNYIVWVDGGPEQAAARSTSCACPASAPTCSSTATSSATA